MNEQIEVGDLVVCIRAAYCCGRDDSVGKFFRVGREYSGMYRCPFCFITKPVGERGLWLEGNRVSQASRLKRIPPLIEPKRTELSEAA